MIPKLNQTDTKQLLSTLTKVYPANDAKCDLRTGWSFNEDTKLMTFSLTCLVSEIEDKQQVDINNTFDKMLKQTSTKAVNVFHRCYKTYTDYTTGANKLTQISVTDLKEMGWVFTLQFRHNRCLRL